VCHLQDLVSGEASIDSLDHQPAPSRYCQGKCNRRCTLGKIGLAVLLFFLILVATAFWFGWLRLSIEGHPVRCDLVLRIEFYQLAKDLKLR